MDNFPDSPQSEQYKLQVIKSYYLYAVNSIDEKKPARFEQVVNEGNDFIDRFPDSKLLAEVQRYQNLSQNNIKDLKNEQVKTSN